jgi:FkbM family methyltransferase
MDDHSQYGEQATILAHFAGRAQGTFLDIGANDGVTLSNTYALHLAGWAGVYVDASPSAFARLRENLPNAEAYNVAIGPANLEVELWESDERSRFMVSTIIPKERERWGVDRFKCVRVQQWSFATLLERCGRRQFDFISIDAEGADLGIFQQIDLTATGTSLVCVEHNGASLAPFREHAAAHGLRQLAANGCNVLFSR